MRKGTKALMVALVTAFGRLVCAQQDQYIVHSWESFEEGVIPKTLDFGHQADAKSFSVLTYVTPGYPKELIAGVAQRECGRYGLLFQPRPSHLFLSVLSPTSLNRDRLGAQGRALYQMDVFVPAVGVKVPNTALLAYAPTGKTKDSFTMYRFGLKEGGDRVYFAYAQNAESAPLKYQYQDLKALKIKRPAWHRFQLIFHGSDQISCAVDGKTTAFSPITEGSIRNLTPGIMTANSEKNGTSVLVDNLSIQWTPTDAPPPESPWTAKQAISEGAANGSFFANNPGVTWLDDPTAAWAIGQQQKRPLLVMFYSPNIAPFNYMLGLDPKTPAVRDKLSRYVLVRVDANQLAGGTLAQRFQVTQVPTLMIVNTLGKPERKLTVRNNKTTWQELEAFF